MHSHPEDGSCHGYDGKNFTYNRLKKCVGRDIEGKLLT